MRAVGFLAPARPEREPRDSSFSLSGPSALGRRGPFCFSSLLGLDNLVDLVLCVACACAFACVRLGRAWEGGGGGRVCVLGGGPYAYPTRLRYPSAHLFIQRGRRRMKELRDYWSLVCDKSNLALWRDELFSPGRFRDHGPYLCSSCCRLDRSGEQQEGFSGDCVERGPTHKYHHIQTYQMNPPAHIAGSGMVGRELQEEATPRWVTAVILHRRPAQQNRRHHNRGARMEQYTARTGRCWCRLW